MADGLMTYQNEKEEADFAIVGTEHIYNFVETYNSIPKVIIDGYDGNSKPTIVVAIDKVTITGADDDSGHLTVIEST